MLLLTLRGTPTIYYGDEIGMVDVPVPPERIQDPVERNLPGFGIGRDGERTPMQWDASAHAGFSTTDPWLPLAADFRSENVENSRRETGSIYQLYRRLIAVRRAKAALTIGRYRPIVAEGDLILYIREHDAERLLIALNLGADPASVQFPQPLQGHVLVSCLADREDERIEAGIELRGDEGLVIELAENSAI
jgi:alpha-glucosidase